jgi:hypothetical protein
VFGGGEAAEQRLAQHSRKGMSAAPAQQANLGSERERQQSKKTYKSERRISIASKIWVGKGS